MSDKTLRYVGPHAEVEVVDYTTGFSTRVAQGDSVTVPAGVGASLLEQGDDHWKASTKKKEG
jgi:uncharacterized protein YjlB